MPEVLDAESATEAPYILKGEHTQRVVKLIKMCWKRNKTPILWGAPGNGKTALVEALSREEDCVGMVRVLLGSADKADTLGMPNRGVIHGKHAEYQVTFHADPHWAVNAQEAQDGDKHFIVFFDEIPQAELDVQGTILTMIHDHIMPSGTKLGMHVKFICAGNPTDDVSSGYELIEPLQNRLSHVTYEPPREEYLVGMREAWGKNVSPEERSLRAMIASYLQTRPDTHLHQMPANGSKENAWPSRRSWDNFASVGADVMGDQDMLTFVATSFIGEAMAMEFVAAMFLIKQHSPEEIITDPSIVDWNDPLTNLYHMTSLTSWADNGEKLQKAIDVIGFASLNGPADIVALSLPEIGNKLGTVCSIAERSAIMKSLDKTTLHDYIHLMFGSGVA